MSKEGNYRRRIASAISDINSTAQALDRIARYTDDLDYELSDDPLDLEDTLSILSKVTDRLIEVAKSVKYRFEAQARMPNRVEDRNVQGSD